MKKRASKVAHNRPRPFYFTVQPRPMAHSPELIFHIMKSRDQTSVLLSVVYKLQVHNAVLIEFAPSKLQRQIHIKFQKNLHFQMDIFSHLDFSHSRRNAFRSVYIDFSIIKSDKSKGLVFGLTGINYGKSHERGSIKRVIEYHGNKVNSDCKVF